MTFDMFQQNELTDYVIECLNHGLNCVLANYKNESDNDLKVSELLTKSSVKFGEKYGIKSDEFKHWVSDEVAQIKIDYIGLICEEKANELRAKR